MIRRGTARRLGLRQWDKNRNIPLSYVSFPDGTQKKIVLVGSRMRACYVDGRGHAGTGPRMTIEPGSVNEMRVQRQVIGE